MPTTLSNRTSHRRVTAKPEQTKNETKSPVHDRYLALVNSLPVGVYRNTPGSHGRFVEANPAIVAMFEAGSKEEFLKRRVSDLYLHPRQRKTFAAKIKKHGFVQNEQLELVTLKGRKFWGLVTAKLTKDRGRLYFDGIIEDITEQKRAEEILRKEELQQRLEQTLDNMIDGCQIISPDFRYLYVNKAVAKQSHQTKDALLGRTMMEMFPGIEKTEMFGHLRRCMTRRRLYSMENEFEFPDGRKVWFELRMEPVPEGVLIFSVDISERKQYEEIIKHRNDQLQAVNKTQKKTYKALLETMKNLQKAKDEINLEEIKDEAILENIGEGLIAIDARGRIMRMNKAAQTLTGYQAESLSGKPITTIPLLDTEGQVIPASKRPIYYVLNQGKVIGPTFAEYYFVRKDGAKFPLGLTVSPIRLRGKIIGAIEIFRDVTEEQQIDQAKTEFVSIASHQLRTPLGISKWYLEAVKEEGYLNSLPKTGKDYLDQVYRSNERVLNVVRDLLSVSRIDQGRVKDNPQRADPAELVEAIVHELRALALKKKVKLGLITAAKQIPAIYIDPLRFHEALQNLISNAIEYTLPGGSVQVVMNRKPGTLIISVHDTGIGISAQDQKKLFTKFFRSEAGASHNTDGSGLGLYVVKSYVEDWGGKVSVESQTGKGSTFTVTLPFKKAKKT